MNEQISPFRRRLELAANRLEELALRSSPSVVVEIRREMVAIREASRLLEGEPCEQCEGRGDQAPRRSASACTWCDGTGDL